VIDGVVTTRRETVGTPATVVAMFPMLIDGLVTGVGPPITDESPDPAKAAGAMATELSAATPPMMARILFIFPPGRSNQCSVHGIPQLRTWWGIGNIETALVQPAAQVVVSACSARALAPTTISQVTSPVRRPSRRTPPARPKPAAVGGLRGTDWGELSGVGPNPRLRPASAPRRRGTRAVRPSQPTA
jgi:hypothetical protein